MDLSNDEPTLVTRSQLLADLRALDVRAGDTLMLHASVRACGWVAGGPRVILEALLELLSADGTLMMLASWEGNPYDSEDWPLEQQRRWIEECPAFDPLTSPADHREMSILAEYLRTWPGARRSDHPLASFVAAGRRAEWLTEHHQLCYGLGADSPLARLCQAGGRVLLLGTPATNLTLLHHAEHLVDLPEKAIDRYRMPILRDGQRVWVEVEEYDTTDGIADFGVEDYFEAIGKAYLASGRGRSSHVGAARSHLLEAGQLTEFAISWMQQNYRGPAS